MSNISDITEIYLAADVQYICHRRSHANFSNEKKRMIHKPKYKKVMVISQKCYLLLQSINSHGG